MEINFGKMPKLTRTEISAFSARLKDRTWAIIPNPFPRNTMHVGRLYRTASQMKAAEYVSPAFLVGDKCWCDGLFMENVDGDTFRKWCIINNAHPFITNEGFCNLDGSFEALNYDHLHVGNFSDTRFDSGYFVVGFDTKIIDLSEENMPVADETKGVACTKLVAFGVCALSAGVDDNNCMWCKEEKLL